MATKALLERTEQKVAAAVKRKEESRALAAALGDELRQAQASTAARRAEAQQWLQAQVLSS